MTAQKARCRLAFRDDAENISSKAFTKQRGFTLIEIIVSIVVITIIMVIAGVGLVEISKGYVFSKKNALTTQQGQIAMMRLKKELSNIASITSVTLTPPSITYTRSSDTPPRPNHTISWAGSSSPILLDGDTLLGSVTSFSLNYYDSYNASASAYSASTSIMEIMLVLMGAENSPMNFTDRVNLYLETGG
jgi:prepilin-type N-terminal cleavage/methylation domain-containing protein